MHVRQSFLHDSKHCNLSLAGKPSEVGWNLQGDMNICAFRKLLRIPLNSGGKPRFIEGRRMEEVRKVANLPEQPVAQRGTLGNQFRFTCVRGPVNIAEHA